MESERIERNPELREPVISVIMPCYNAAKYLAKSIQSVISQTHTNWELIIVNDGSTDGSELIAKEFAASDNRITVHTKSNGGYVSARIHGYRFIHPGCQYVIFYDADDMLHPTMLKTLLAALESDSLIGAAYCDHVVMDENDVLSNSGYDMKRYVPTAFWVRHLDEAVPDTPFISIFCWTKMIEPMTLIRRQAYEETPGWDIDFGKGTGNIGEGVYLFSEIALKWKIRYVNQQLYYYRRHQGQMSGVAGEKMKEQGRKVIVKWQNRLQEGFGDSNKIRLAIQFYRYRLSAYNRVHSLLYQVRYKPLTAPAFFLVLVFEYIASLPLAFSYKKLLR